VHLDRIGTCTSLQRGNIYKQNATNTAYRTQEIMLINICPRPAGTAIS